MLKHPKLISQSIFKIFYVALRFEEHSRVSCIYFQVPINLLKTDEYNQQIFVFLFIFNVGLGHPCTRPPCASKYSAVADFKVDILGIASVQVNL